MQLRGTLVDGSTGEVLGETEREKPCGTKRCAFCGPRLKRRLVAHYIEAFKRSAGLRFVTLTLDPKSGVTVDESRRYAIYAWSRWRKRIARIGPLEFFAAPEEHASGYTHIHAILDASASDDELRAHWFAVGGGAVVDVQTVAGDDLPRRVGYLVKYVLKDAALGGPLRRRSLLTSAGVGYNSADARAARAARVPADAAPGALARDYVAAAAAGADAAAGGPDGGTTAPRAAPLMELWSTSARNLGGGVGYVDTVTAEDVRRWRRLDRANVTRRYRTKERGVWVEYAYGPDLAVSRRVLDGYASPSDLPPRGDATAAPA